ncbi:MAG: hypothetical protein ACRCZY_10575 [Phocaeicola sp.]
MRFIGDFWLEYCIYFCGAHVNVQFRFKPVRGKEESPDKPWGYASNFVSLKEEGLYINYDLAVKVVEWYSFYSCYRLFTNPFFSMLLPF